MWQPEAEARQHLFETVDADPDVMRPWHRFAVGESLSSLRNVRPLFCVCMASWGGSGSRRDTPWPAFSPLSPPAGQVQVAIDDANLSHRPELKIPADRVDRATQVPSRVCQRRVVNEPGFDRPLGPKLVDQFGIDRPFDWRLEALLEHRWILAQYEHTLFRFLALIPRLLARGDGRVDE